MQMKVNRNSDISKQYDEANGMPLVSFSDKMRASIDKCVIQICSSKFVVQKVSSQKCWRS